MKLDKGNRMPHFINIADLDSGSGKSYREINLAKKHNLQVGQLVEISKTNCRLFIVKLTRDCDGTPLYTLCHDKDDVIVNNAGFGNYGWVNGFTEDSLDPANK